MTMTAWVVQSRFSREPQWKTEWSTMRPTRAKSIEVFKLFYSLLPEDWRVERDRGFVRCVKCEVKILNNKKGEA